MPREVDYEIGELGTGRGLFGGLLKKVQLPDVKLKPHRDLTYLLLGTAGVLVVGAVLTAREINKNQYYEYSN